MKRDTLTLAKFKRLRRRGEFRTVEAAGILDVLWLFTARNCPDGFISTEITEDLAEEMGYGIDEIDPVLNVLTETHWLDKTDGGYIVHDWPEHCEDSVHLRLARSGKSFADGTLPKTTRLSKTERERLPSQEEQTQAHAVRTESAQQAQENAPRVHCRSRSRSRSRSRGLCQAVTVADAPHDANGTAVHAHQNGTAETVGDILKRGSRTSGAISVSRILAASHDPPEAAEYWTEVCQQMHAAREIETLRDALNKVETEGGFEKPAAYLNRRCSEALKRHGQKMPKPWKKTV